MAHPSTFGAQEPSDFSAYPSTAWYSIDIEDSTYNSTNFQRGFAINSSTHQMAERDLVKLLIGGDHLRAKNPRHLNYANLDAMLDKMETKYPFLARPEIPVYWRLQAFRRWARFTARSYQVSPASSPLVATPRRRARTPGSTTEASADPLSSPSPAPTLPYRPYYACFVDMTYTQDLSRHITVSLKSLLEEGAEQHDNLSLDYVKLEKLEAAIQRSFALEWAHAQEEEGFEYSREKYEILYRHPRTLMKRVITNDSILQEAIQVLRVRGSPVISMQLHPRSQRKRLIDALRTDDNDDLPQSESPTSRRRIHAASSPIL